MDLIHFSWHIGNLIYWNESILGLVRTFWSRNRRVVELLERSANVCLSQIQGNEYIPMLKVIVEINKTKYFDNKKIGESDSWLEGIVYVSEGRIVHYETCVLPPR